MKSIPPLLQALEEHESALRKFFTARVSCPHTAADLFQQMAEKLLRQKKNKDVDNPRAYLYQTARNELVSHYRGENTREQYETEYADRQSLNDAASIEQAIIDQHKIQALNLAVTELPLLSQKIFWLYRIEHLRQKDIAIQLDISLSTVEKHLATAMQYCRQRLREKDYGYSPRDASSDKKR